ncbi:glycosyltransferase family 4 protein [Aquimarina sediminis]|uniref:glycosyltransferase family 4 protein n=1 Tax=Aquimarina sediminis TaxID=2070536 RepID=UPI000CA03A8C|nr:glycosyltransferase family 4 protein [Aquimarina sediminis]
MHILHLSAVTNWGGGEKQIESLCYELAKSNPEIKNTILCARNTPFHQRLKETNLDFITAPLKIKVDPRFILRIGIFCKNENVSLIHIHEPSALLSAILADKLYNLPPFVFSKKTSFPIKQRKKTLYKYNYQKIKKVICVSEETKKVASKGIKNHDKLVVVYDGTNIKTKNTETPFLLREKYNIPTSKKLIGNIANHIKAKHLDTLINVANIIINKEKRDDFVFIQIGTFSELTEALLSRIKELNLEGYIIFTGYTPDASNFLPQFDISLITSQIEGMPLVIYESMYHKIPIISTAVGGIPEIIEHNVNGLLAPAYDSEMLSNHITNLSSSPTLQKDFVQKGAKKLTERFTTSNMAQNTLKIYKMVLSND